MQWSGVRIPSIGRLSGVTSVGQLLTLFWCRSLLSATKFTMGVAVAIPACSLCINRRLYHIVSVDSVTKTMAEKRRDILIDLAIGIGIPVLEMVLGKYASQKMPYNFDPRHCSLYSAKRPFLYSRGSWMLVRN